MSGSEDERIYTEQPSDVESFSEEEDTGRHWASKFILDESATTGHLPSTFDAYFSQISRSSKTSTNIFSELVEPLTPEEYNDRIREVKGRSSKLTQKLSALEELHSNYFQSYISELAAGFNLLFYGYGSKRNTLNKLARTCSKKGHVVIGNAFFPNFNLRDFLSAAEQVIGAPDIPNVGVGAEAQCKRIIAKYVQKPVARHLFLFIHNIDGPSLRTERARNCLSSLASHPSIHIIASIDHIMAPMLWSSTDLFASTGTDKSIPTTVGQKLPDGGFAWVWHDLTTMQPYDFELAFADHTSYAGASTANQRAGAGSSALSSNTISEGAAKHVLASVTAKAKRLFALLCSRQLASLNSASVDSGSTSQSSPQVATSYELLFASARDEFIATNDTAMQALLGEFRDHGLVLSTTSTEGGEALWIPLPKEALVRLSTSIN